jgi:hypothetical protein
VSPFLLLPLLLRWSSEKLSEPSSSLAWPRTRSTTFQPPSPTQSPPAAIPVAELRPSPWAAPSQPSPAKLSLPLESPAFARAKPPSLGPRTGPPATGHHPSLGWFATPSGRDAVPPPRSRWQVGPQRRRHPRAQRRLPLALGPPLGRKRSRARAWGGPKAVSPAQEKKNSLFFFLFPPFFHLNGFLNILCTKNYQKGFPRLHTIMLLENDTL